MYKIYLIDILCVLATLTATLCVANGQAGSGNWGAGSGVGAWSSANSPAMHNPPNLAGTPDHQYSYGYAGVDSRGPYGGAGGNGGYYVSGTDEHGRPFSYNSGQPGIYPGGRPDYPGAYGYRGGAAPTETLASMSMALALFAVGLTAWN